MKIVLTPEEASKILINALVIEGKIKEGVETDVTWSFKNFNNSNCEIIIEQR